MKESVKQLITDKINALGLSHFFDVLEAEIRGRNGSLIIFRGMQSYNAETIKSLEGYDVAWVEEAQSLSEISLRMLRPTIRKSGSELWFSWNPRHDSDAVDKFFRGENPPKGATIVEANYYDNPWFPDELRAEMERDFEADPDMAHHVWGGGYQVVSEGAYYARLIAECERTGRVGDYPYRPALPLRTAWDIGVDDYTAVWFVQDDGYTVTVVDYYEATGEGADQIVAAAMPELVPNAQERERSLLALGRAKPFKYAEHFLPHDVRNREWGAGARSRRDTLHELGVKPIRIGVAQSPEDRINAVRRILPITKFNRTKRVELGLSRLRNYRRKMNDVLGVYQGPVHDINSHGADAFGEYAVNCGIYPEKPKPKRQLVKEWFADDDDGDKVDWRTA